jgi:hypothetical protein
MRDTGGFESISFRFRHSLEYRVSLEKLEADHPTNGRNGFPEPTVRSDFIDTRKIIRDFFLVNFFSPIQGVGAWLRPRLNLERPTTSTRSHPRCGIRNARSTSSPSRSIGCGTGPITDRVAEARCPHGLALRHGPGGLAGSGQREARRPADLPGPGHRSCTDDPIHLLSITRRPPSLRTEPTMRERSTKLPKRRGTGIG